MGPNPVRNAQEHAGPIDMEEISRDIQVLPEETLQKIAKGPLVKFTLTSDNIENVTRVFKSLVKTFACASISHSNTTAACNALSAFLDSAFVSPFEQTRQLARSQETLVSVFDTFLTRYKDVKPKPMKQVLESLAVILTKIRHEPEKDAIQRELADAVLPSIMLGEPRSRLKASIIALEMLLRKNAILPTELVSLVERWLLYNSERWPHVLQEECQMAAIDVSQFLQRYPGCAAVDIRSKKTAVQILLLGLLARSKATELAASSGEVMAVFFQKLKLSADSPVLSSETELRFAFVWVQPIKHFLLRNLDVLEKFSNYILQRLFSVSAAGFLRFLVTLPLNSLLAGDMSSSSSDELTLLFASLQIGKKIGLVHEDHHFSKLQAKSTQEENVLVLKSEFIGQFLFHYDFDIKMAALSLLITAPSSTKPVSSAAIRAILKSLPSLHAESDSCTRGEILSLVRGLIVRLKGGILANHENVVALKPRAPESKKQQPVFARDDAETRTCMKDYLDFLMADLRPTASYHRHIMALKTIVLLLESGLDVRFQSSVSGKPENNQVKWKFHMEIFGRKLLRLLADLLLDPYDEVRATALNILKLFPHSVLFSNAGGATSGSSGESPEMIEALMRAEILASNTSRADHADTVARLYHIIFYTAGLNEPHETPNWWDTKAGVVETILSKLEDKLSSSEGLFNSSLRDAPLHGYLSALRFIVSSSNFYSSVSSEGSTSSEGWRSIHTRISSICDTIWQEVKPQLCIDSPEGHAAEPIEDLKVGPKDILSYSWRALRESSLLLHATLSNETYGPRGGLGLTRGDYEKIGKTSFTQLAELRHRGAFSTVAQTFASCCQRCGQSKNPEISALPLLWYQEAKKIIFETASKLTRRSAGLPALIAGILLSNPGGPLFLQVIRELQDIAHLPAQQDDHNQTMELPQVHAMNCLREVFTNARLGPHTEGFIMPALNLSAERLGSPIWALRNSGLMLFRALVNRMCRNDFQGFGGRSGSEPGARISFQKYPGLVQLLSGLLSPPDQAEKAEQRGTAMVTERVFPALELIAEKIPYSSDSDDDMLRALVREHLKSPVWGIREHAARVYASLLSRQEIPESIQKLRDARDAETQNYLHGESLCIRYSLRRFAYTPSAVWNARIGEVTSTIKTVFAASYPVAASPFVATTLLEMISDAVERSVESGAEGEMVEILDYILDTYRVSDALDYVYASNPCWNALSTTRAFSLLRREVSWVKILKMLMEGDATNLETFLHKVATLDPNACQWVLEKLHETFGEKEHYKRTLISLYASIITGNLPLEVKTAAISNLASSLQVMLESDSAELQALDLPWEALGGQIRVNSTKKGFNRDRSDADLQLEGCLMAAKSARHRISDTEILEWATRLRFALREETEFTTRHAAATSIAAFAQVLRPTGAPPRLDGLFLEIYLILYDLLNDDDEELRDIAASTASWILSYSSVSPQKTVTLSPLNASELFASFLADNYTTSNLLCTRTVRYILGQEPRISDAADETSLTAVSSVLAELRKESTILFEEEKQNLFIEAVREVDVWSGVLARLAGSSFDERLLRQVFNWVEEGLSCFSETLASQDGKDGPIGWVAKPEVYTLGVRVISLASVMISKGFGAKDALGDGQAALREKLEMLLGRGRDALLHDDLVLRIRVGLNCS